MLPGISSVPYRPRTALATAFGGSASPRRMFVDECQIAAESFSFAKLALTENDNARFCRIPAQKFRFSYLTVFAKFEKMLSRVGK